MKKVMFLGLVALFATFIFGSALLAQQPAPEPVEGIEISQQEVAQILGVNAPNYEKGLKNLCTPTEYKQSGSEQTYIFWVYYFEYKCTEETCPVQIIINGDSEGHGVFGIEDWSLTNRTPPSEWGWVGKPLNTARVLDFYPYTMSLPIVEDYMVSIEGRSVEIEGIEPDSSYVKFQLLLPVGTKKGEKMQVRGYFANSGGYQHHPTCIFSSPIEIRITDTKPHQVFYPIFFFKGQEPKPTSTPGPPPLPEATPPPYPGG